MCSYISTNHLMPSCHKSEQIPMFLLVVWLGARISITSLPPMHVDRREIGSNRLMNHDFVVENCGEQLSDKAALNSYKIQVKS